MISFFVPIEPVAYARSRHRGKQHFLPAAQSAFMATIGTYATRAMSNARMKPIEGRPVRLIVRFIFTHPASWTQAKKDATAWKTSKPDTDNLVKILKDAMNKIVWKDDALVADEHVQKMYGGAPGIVVTVDVLEGEAA